MTHESQASAIRLFILAAERRADGPGWPREPTDGVIQTNRAGLQRSGCSRRRGGWNSTPATVILRKLLQVGSIKGRRVDHTPAEAGPTPEELGNRCLQAPLDSKHANVIYCLRGRLSAPEPILEIDARGDFELGLVGVIDVIEKKCSALDAQTVVDRWRVVVGDLTQVIEDIRNRTGIERFKCSFRSTQGDQHAIWRSGVPFVSVTATRSTIRRLRARHEEGNARIGGDIEEGRGSSLVLQACHEGEIRQFATVVGSKSSRSCCLEELLKRGYASRGVHYTRHDSGLELPVGAPVATPYPLLILEGDMKPPHLLE